MRIVTLLALAALVPLAACGSVREAAMGPQLSPMGYPSQLVPREANLMPMAQVRNAGIQPASANSLWRANARAFFIDQRASRVGDILTVQIDIDDSAKTTNSTQASRSSGIGSSSPRSWNHAPSRHCRTAAKSVRIPSPSAPVRFRLAPLSLRIGKRHASN